MVGYQYTYIIGDIILFFIWMVLFLWRKNVRRQMLIISAIFGIIGPLTEVIYIKDWWRPLTITNTSIGIEDFLFGFLIGGIAAVIYEEIFKKKIKTGKTNKSRERKRNFNLMFLIVLMAILFCSSFYLLNLNSFISTTITFIIPTLIIYIKRKDLIINSLVTGSLLLIIAFSVYSLLELITPGWVETFWHFRNIPKVIILNVPLEEIIWFFLAGALIGPLYEYWQEGKLINIRKHSKQ